MTKDLKQLNERYEAGTATADEINLIGRAHYHGVDAPKNNEKALQFFKAAAEKGAIGGLYNCGAMHNNGEGTAQNAAVAADYFAAAEANKSFAGREAHKGIYRNSPHLIIASRIVNANPWLKREEKNIAGIIGRVIRELSTFNDRHSGHDKVLSSDITGKLNFSGDNDIARTKAIAVIRDVTKEYANALMFSAKQREGYSRLR